MSNNGVWIWENEQPKFDKYADFLDSFSVKTANEPVLLIIKTHKPYAVC